MESSIGMTGKRSKNKREMSLRKSLKIFAGRYQAIETLGRGSYGTVFLVTELTYPHKRWALKEMSEALIPEEDRDHALKLFRREAEILARLNHPGLPSIREFFSINDKHYLAMEYVDGENLEVVRELENGIFDYHEILDWAIQLALILDYLHKLNPEPIIFRDLKPSNIMLTYPDRRIMLVDFGIARYFNPGKLKDTQFLGTQGFSPPEQYGRGQSDQRSDIYSFGATLYYLLTSQDMKSCGFQFRKIVDIRNDVPLSFDRMIMKCLALNPGERFQSMSEILEELYDLNPDTFSRRNSQNVKIEKAAYLEELSKFYFTGCPYQYPNPPSNLKKVEKKGTFTTQEFSGQLLECHSETHWVKAKKAFGILLFPLMLLALTPCGTGDVQYQKQTVAMVEFEGADFPKFLLRSESLLDAGFLGDDPDIDFADNPVFSKNFYLTGPDREAVESFFRPELIETFGRDPVNEFKKIAFFTLPGACWILEAEGRHIIFYLPGAVIHKNNMQLFIEHAQKVLLPFIRKVKSRL